MLKFTSEKSNFFVNDTLEKTEPYYLSNTFVNWGVSSFDFSKKGTVLNGKYLITPTRAYYISELTDTKLVLVSYYRHLGDILLSTTEMTYLKN